MTKAKSKAKPEPPPPVAPARMVSFRLSAEVQALIDALALHYRPAPGMSVTKTAVVELAIRELAERQLGSRK